MGHFDVSSLFEWSLIKTTTTILVKLNEEEEDRKT
jgi:hypothetical protein